MSRGESVLRAARPVQISAGLNTLAGDLAVPSEPNGLILFAHGSGSSRFSPRNRYVADTLFQRGFATLLIDLLTAHEEEIDESSGRYRFDVRMLADRLIGLYVLVAMACAAAVFVPLPGWIIAAVAVAGLSGAAGLVLLAGAAWLSVVGTPDPLLSCGLAAQLAVLALAWMSVRKVSVSKLSCVPCSTAATRSSPAPVSTEGAGNGVSSYLSPTFERLNCMKTRFQISIVVSPTQLTSSARLYSGSSGCGPW